MKKTFKIMFFVSLFVVVLLSVLIVISLVSAVGEHTSAVGIIGGADGPTAIFITRSLMLENPVFVFACVAFLLCVVSAIGWALAKKK